MATLDGAGSFAYGDTGGRVIRVVVTGSECTGKTTLAEALAESYGTVAVPEYARLFVGEKGAAPAYRDVETIARGQIEVEGTKAVVAMPITAIKPMSLCGVT